MASDETLKQNDATNQILQAISDLNRNVADFRREANERFTKIETEIEEIKQSQFSFDVRLDRVQAMAHDALNIGHDLKADVKILTAELRAWAADVAGLQQQNLIPLKK
jgi:hypothetical protein